LHLVDAKAGRQRHVFEGTYQREIFALIRREVDAIYVKGPLGAQLAHDLHLHVVADIRDHPDPLERINCSTPRPITVGTEFLRNHPDLVVRFLSRIVAIGAWARLHPNEIAHYIARQSGATEHWVREAYGSNLYKCLCTNLDALSIAGMDAYKSFLLQWGFLKQDFDMTDWIDPVPLSRASSVLRKSVA
jgi:ABC-type nitrate/sulfonate/bicarbonate transport system substrate-binding protein